jgi:acyl-CoA dehydrogenase
MNLTHPELLEAAKKVGQAVAAAHADAVDKDARFPHESFAALKEQKLLSIYVPKELGGAGASVEDVVAICHALGHHCASTAMIYAMHQIQVACVVHHGLTAGWHREFLADLVKNQLLLASATSEAGIGGNVRTSSCAVVKDGGGFTLEKNATVVSYGEAADAILITARANPDAAPSDQVLVVSRKADLKLSQSSSWDTLGMRGTCSNGYLVKAEGELEAILPLAYADISARTMLPFAHLTWSALWLGIAADAVNRARAFVRGEARKNPSVAPPGALRVAELMSELQQMRANLTETAGLYSAHKADPDFLSSLPFAIRMNLLKVGTSDLAAKVVHQALRVCGIHGYKNDSKFSLGRHLRDAHSAALMVSNDRILGNTAQLLLATKEEASL